MSAEFAIAQINAVLDDYIEGRIKELRALARIAQILGQYLADKR